MLLRKPVIWLLLLLIALATACDGGSTLLPTPDANMPNPASVFCEENGGTLEIRSDAAGGQVGYCLFADGSECEEWAYYRGECAPGGAGESSAPGAALANPASVFCGARGGTLAIRNDAAGGQVGYCLFADGSECEEWAYYRGDCAPAGWRAWLNPAAGYRFEYPADATIVPNDDPTHSINVNGPLRDGDFWPQFTISAPADDPAWQPPADADLAQWLTTHNLLEGARQADVTIGGAPAVHIRFDRSPQSYAYDRYYVAHGGRLYMIVIGHTADHEDWPLYERFLASFAFMP